MTIRLICGNRISTPPIMSFVFVERMDEVLRLALLEPVSDELADEVKPEPSPGIAGVTTPADREEPSVVVGD